MIAWCASFDQNRPGYLARSRWTPGSSRILCKPMADFDAIIEDTGGDVQPIPQRHRWDLLQAWRQVYAARLHAATGKWRCRDYDWHVFSEGYAPACAGRKALDAYERLDPPARIIVVPHANRFPAP